MAKKALGKGLGALIGAAEADHAAPVHDHGVMEIDLNKIEPNRAQPRKYFDDEGLRELAESLKQYGVIQPLIVTRENDYYSIVAGERRWRAARLAGLSVVPVVVKDYTTADILQVALIENIQREDLNPIEEALCYRRLADEYFFTQEEIAAKVGKSRNSISYALGLLNLDGRVQNLIIEGKLTAGHARHLLPVKDGDTQFDLAEAVIENEAGVRETEKFVKHFLANADKEKKDTPTPPRQSPDFLRLEKDLRHIFGTKVNIKDGKTKGRIEIEYYTPEEFERLLGLFKNIK